MKRKMTKAKKIVQDIYYSDRGKTQKEKVELMQKEAGISRSYAYELYGRLEMNYLIRCFDRD